MHPTLHRLRWLTPSATDAPPARDTAYFVAVIEASPDCVRIVDVNGLIEFANAACEKQFGAANGQVGTWTDLWPVDAPVGSIETLREAAGGKVLSFRTICPVADDGSRCWETVISPIEGRNGAGSGRLFTRSTDVTEEIERLHFLGAVVEATPAALFVKDGITGRYLLANRAAESLLGFSREEMIGRDDHALFPKDQADFFRGIDRQVIEAGGVTLIEEEEVTSGQGDHRWSRTRKSAVEGLGGAKYLIAVAEDITEAKEAKDALHKALAEAEAANRAKSEFLTNMSHEIRTPLNGVLGMVQVMLADELSPNQKDHLRVIRRSGETLLSILNDLLDIARIEAHAIESESIDFDVEHAVRNAVAPFLPLAETKGLAVHVIAEEAAEGLFRGDGARFRRVIQNLISNAVKFTDAGRIDVLVSNNGDGIRVVVADTGIGIEPDQTSLIFEAFAQVDPSLTRRHGGAGLGLSICRTLTDQMGGSISVESTTGQGARFILDLPFARALPVEISADLPEPMEVEFTPRVLAAEDNAVNQHVLKTLPRHLEGH